MTITMKTKSTKQQISKFIQSDVLIPRTKSRKKPKPSSVLNSNSSTELSNSPLITIKEDEADESDGLDASNSSIDGEFENLGFGSSSKNVVWAKAYSYTWWPGIILKEYRSKFLVDFFNCEKSLWFHETEIRRFGSIRDTDFEPVRITKNNRDLILDQETIDTALAEYSSRLVKELTCPCQDDDGEEKADVEVMKEFHSGGVLEMVRDIGVSPSFDDVDAVSVIWAAAHVNAFRCYAFLKRDWIYRETMWLSEGGNDSDDYAKGTCSEDETESLLSEEPEEYEEEEIEEEEEEIEEEEEEEGGEDDCQNGTIGALSAEDEYYKEKEEDEDRKEEEGEDGEDSSHNGFLMQIGIDSAECKRNSKEHTEEDESLWKLKIAAKEAFKPIKVLDFVHRMAINTWVEGKDTNSVTKAATQVKRFRRHCYAKHDSDYWSAMRLSESTDDFEANMKSASWEDEQTCNVVQPQMLSDDDKGNSHELLDKRMNDDSVIGKNIIEGPLFDTLNHLYCLAVDHFYSGAQRNGMKNLDSMSQRFLSYRKFIHQKVLDRNPRLKYPSYQDRAPDSSKDQKLSGVSSIVHHQDGSDETVAEGSISISKEEENEESDLLIKLWSKRKKRARVEGKTDHASIGCSVTTIEDVSEEVSRNVVDTLKDRCDSILDSECNKRLKTRDVNACVSNNHVESRDVIEPYISDCNGGSDSSERKKTEGVKVCSSTDNMKSGRVGVGDASKETLDCHLPSASSKTQIPKSLEVRCNTGNEFGDLVDERRDSPDFTRKSGSNKRQKICMYDSVSTVPQLSTKILHGHDAYSVKNDNHDSYEASHARKDHLNNKRHSEADNSGRTKDLKVGCSLKPVSDRAEEAMSHETTGAQYKDEVRVGKKRSSSHGQHLYNGDFHLSSDSASDLSNKQPTIVSQGISGGSGKSSQLIIKKTKPLPPLNTLYVSPLSAGSPATSGNSKSQPSKSRTDPDRPATLHMKFPKDFKLPSKDELVKKFRPFGPIDYLETKVYFYTGSAQVVFQHGFDAETAYDCAKVEKIFTDNVRFWVRQPELSRSEMKTSALSSLPKGVSSMPYLKPCLKVPNPQGMKSERKVVNENSPSGNQVPRSATPETKNEVLTRSYSGNYSNNGRPDISREMHVLLERCNQVVTQIKDNLGIHNFYTLLTHNFCDEKFDKR